MAIAFHWLITIAKVCLCMKKKENNVKHNYYKPRIYTDL